jgi:hypothetical protein
MSHEKLTAAVHGIRRWVGHTEKVKRWAGTQIAIARAFASMKVIGCQYLRTASRGSPPSVRYTAVDPSPGPARGWRRKGATRCARAHLCLADHRQRIAYYVRAMSCVYSVLQAFDKYARKLLPRHERPQRHSMAPTAPAAPRR